MLTLKLLRGYQMKLVIVKFRIQKKKSILDIQCIVKVKNSLTWKTLGLPKAFGDIHGKETH